MEKEKMEKLLEVAVKAAIEAGEEIKKIYGQDDFQVELKEDESPLTIADKTAHKIIVKHLDSTGIPVLSEEGKEIPFEERSQWNQLWIVDPLDGTKEFIKRNGEFTVNIALVKDGNPILGVIYVPVTKDLYYAAKDLGSFKAVNADTESFVDLKYLMTFSFPLPFMLGDDTFKVVGSRSHMNEDTENYISNLKEKHSKIEFVSRGSSLKICMIAEGLADIYPRFAPTMEWDTAAGHAIAEISGAIVTQSDEKTPVVYNKEDLLNPWFIIKRE